MSAQNAKDLSKHIGHEFDCVEYAGGENVALECATCCEVIIDFNAEDEV